MSAHSSVVRSPGTAWLRFLLTILQSYRPCVSQPAFPSSSKPRGCARIQSCVVVDLCSLFVYWFWAGTLSIPVGCLHSLLRGPLHVQSQKWSTYHAPNPTHAPDISPGGAQSPLRTHLIRDGPPKLFSHPWSQVHSDISSSWGWCPITVPGPGIMQGMHNMRWES